MATKNKQSVMREEEETGDVQIEMAISSRTASITFSNDSIDLFRVYDLDELQILIKELKIVESALQNLSA